MDVAARDLYEVLQEDAREPPPTRPCVFCGRRFGTYSDRPVCLDCIGAKAKRRAVAEHVMDEARAGRIPRDAAGRPLF